MKSEELDPIIHALDNIKEDKRVPKNIREGCEECMKILDNEDGDFSVRINSCVSILDEISNDPNIPMYTRTQVWNIVSMLETVGVSEKT